MDRPERLNCAAHQEIAQQLSTRAAEMPKVNWLLHRFTPLIVKRQNWSSGMNIPSILLTYFLIMPQ